MRRQNLSYYLIIFLFTTLFGCSNGSHQDHKVIAKVNDYDLTLNEFQYQLASELELEKDFKLTKTAKREFLEQLIRKELLIQEAKKLKLDTKEEFRRAIEKYWESTLIKNLLELKSREISKRCIVSEEEIQDRYKRMKKENPNLPALEQIRDKILETLREEKKTRLLDQWISELRNKANVKIDESLL